MKIISAFTSDNIKDERPLVKKTIMAGNGIFEEQKSWLGKSLKKVNDYEIGKEYPFLDESVEIDLIKEFPLIPKKALETVIKWYSYITDKNGEEAQVIFYRKNGKNNEFTLDDNSKMNLKEVPGIKFWNDEIFSYTPIQNNSAALTSVSKSDKYYQALNRGYGLYVETHSHNSMNAFRSSTDEKYSYNDGIQLVFGKLNTENPEMYSWACIRGLQKPGLESEELNRFLELPLNMYQQASQKVEFFKDELKITKEDEILFKEWDKQIEIKVYTPSYTSRKYTKNLTKQSSKTKSYQIDWWNNYYDSNFPVYSSEKTYSYMTHEEKLDEVASNVILYMDENYNLTEKQSLIVDLLVEAFTEGLSTVSYTSKSVQEITDKLTVLIEGRLILGTEEEF